MNNVKYIFFDIGYTLVNEDLVWEKRCEDQAKTKEARALNLTPGAIYKEIVDASLVYLPQYRTLVNKFGFTEIAPFCHELERLYPDTKETLEVLSHSYKLGVIANQPDKLTSRLKAFQILDYFNVVISSFDYNILKPDKKLFEAALEKAGCNANEALMIGDRLDNDIYPAKALGMKTIWIKQGFGGMQKPKSNDYIPDMEINHLSELLPILAKNK